MSSDLQTDLYVVAVTEKGVKCAREEGDSETFWLPRSHVKWGAELEVGAVVGAIVPGWLARKHRQLVGDKEFERGRRL